MKTWLYLILSSVVMAQEPIAVTDVEALKAHLNEEVTVSGVPNASSKSSKEGHFFYHFDGTSFTVFCFQASAEVFPEEKRPSAVIGKTITFTGKVTMYKEKPQIAIRKAEQVEIVAGKATEKTSPTVDQEKPKDVEKKKD